MKNKIAISIVTVIVVAVGWFAFDRGGVGDPRSLDGFAQCLSERGFTMYGAYWCPHCQNEKRAFGDSLRYIKYVECTKEPKQCAAAGIKGYPTWVTEDGRQFEGEQGVEKLARASGCELTESKVPR